MNYISFSEQESESIWVFGSGGIGSCMSVFLNPTFCLSVTLRRTKILLKVPGSVVKIPLLIHGRFS